MKPNVAIPLLFLALAVAAMLAWSVWTGVFSLRGGGQINRRDQPIAFFGILVLGCLADALLFSMVIGPMIAALPQTAN